MSDATSSGDNLVLLAEEFAERFRRGERPGLTEYTDKYPELAEQIRELFPAMVVMEEFGSVGGQATGPYAKGMAAHRPIPHQLGDYRILREVAHGGMGIVYEAVQESLGRHVALKVFPFQSLIDANYLERFRREARAAARLHHTNIVPVFGVGEHEGIHYYAMQFIQGQSLHSVLQELRQLRRRTGVTPVLPAGQPTDPSPQVEQASRLLATGETPVPPNGQENAELSASIAQGLITGRFPAPAPERAMLSPPTLAPAASGPSNGGESMPPADETPEERHWAASSPSPLGGEGRGEGLGALQPSPPHRHPFSPKGRGGNGAEGSSARSGSLTVNLTGGSDLTMQSDRQYFRSAARVGLQVAEALAYAHQQGILHRDIKPSNLLLDIQGTVWVTDFGLAKAEGTEELTTPGDIVGTLRFMAPERFQGKADPRSDVFSLGLTLYEMLTLQPAYAETDRARLVERILHDEPLRPRKLDARIPRDLETIVLKAIAKEPGARYEKAAELAEDLRRFMADRPVQARRSRLPERLWRWCRRNPAVASLLTLVVASLALAAGVFAVQTWRLDRALERTTDAERQARLREADALVGQAHGTRLSRRPGQRFAALESLGKAASIGRELRRPPEWFDRLRNEAIAALALPDIHITQEWDGFPPGSVCVALSDDFEWYVRTTTEGACTIRRVADDSEVAPLPALGEPALAEFGPGRVMVLCGDSLPRRLQLWDLGDGTPVLRFEEGRASGVHQWHFRPDGKLLGLSHMDGSISVYDLTTGARVHRLAPLEIIKRAEVLLHPTEPFAAVASYFHRPVQVRDLRSGAVVAQFVPPWGPGSAGGAWAPDGRTLAVPDDNHSGKIQLLSFDPAAPALLPLRLLEGPHTGGNQLCYNPAGDRLVGRGWSSIVHLFDPVSGQLLFSTHSLRATSRQRLRFDRTGQRLSAARVGEREERVGLWSVADGREYRVLVHTGSGEAHGILAIHPGGRLVALSLTDGVSVFDLETGGELAHLAPSPGSKNPTFMAFDGAGNLLTNGFEGFFRWPVRPDATNAGRLLMGPPERLPFNPGQCGIASSHDGQVIAQPMYQGYGMGPYAGGWILHPNSPTPRRVDAGVSMNRSSVSPDGRWVAFGHHETRVNIFDAATGQRVWQSPADGHNYCRFSPDGRWLVTDVDGCRVYAIGTWKPGPQLGPGTPWDVTPELAVLGQSNGIYRLVELSTGRELARLEDPEQGTRPAAFTPDGTKLVVAAKNGLRVWDLRRIREELSKLGLDWDAPLYPPAEERTSSKPLQVEVDMGELIEKEKARAKAPSR